MNDDELNDKTAVLIRDMDSVAYELRKRGENRLADALDRAATLLEMTPYWGR